MQKIQSNQVTLRRIGPPINISTNNCWKTIYYIEKCYFFISHSSPIYFFHPSFFSNPPLKLQDPLVGPTDPIVNLKKRWMRDGWKMKEQHVSITYYPRDFRAQYSLILQTNLQSQLRMHVTRSPSIQFPKACER